MVLGRQDYQWKHEPCLYGWKDGASHNWYSDRSQTTVIDMDKPSRSADHPTMKPVPLFAYEIQNSTKTGGYRTRLLRWQRNHAYRLRADESHGSSNGARSEILRRNYSSIPQRRRSSTVRSVCGKRWPAYELRGSIRTGRSGLIVRRCPGDAKEN